MSESDSPSHWDSVADEIGVTPGAEPPRPEPTSAPSDTQRRVASDDVQDREPPPAAPRPVSDWNLLAEELGVVPTPPSQRPAPPTTTGRRPQVEQAPKPEPEDAATSEASATRATEDLTEAEDIDTPEGGPLTASLDVVEEQVDFGEAELEAKDKGEEEDGGGGRRRRRRRPRRRSTKKRVAKEDAATAKDQTTTAADAQPAAEGPAEDQPPEDQPASDQRTGAADDQQADGEHEQPEPAPEPSPARPSRPSHRNIPPWEEAVRVIVDANIEARASRSKAGKGRSRGGRGRGRKH